MDFLKNLFGIKQTDKSINIIGINNENLVKIIDDQITHLRKRGLSSIPESEDDKISQQLDLNRHMIRIIYFLDILLMERLNFSKNTLDKKQDYLHSNQSISGNSDKHYWVYISKYFNIPSVKYLNMDDSLKTHQEKGLAWITISILENSLLDSFRQIYQMNFDKKFYEKSSYLIEKKSEILQSLGNLSTFNLLNSFNVEIYRHYLFDKQQRNVNRENFKDFDMGLDVPGMSPIKKPKAMDFLITPIELLPKTSNLNIQRNFT